VGVNWDHETNIRFEGSWKEFAPIALTNLFLMIVTLGIYRFWATNRERQYLWSRTCFHDDRFEWTGTGRELFLGFLIVVVVLFIPILFFQFGMQALLFRKYTTTAFVLAAIFYAVIIYVTGLARYRSLRYRLSRTWWRGIRGGGDGRGYRYGLTTLWRNLAGYLAVGLLLPWSSVSLWNERWRTVGFGSIPFVAQAKARPIFGRYLLFYMVPLLMVILIIATLVLTNGHIGDLFFYSTAPMMVTIALYVVIVIGIYLLLTMIGMVYYSAYVREIIGGLTLGKTSFVFDASAGQWLTLYVVDILLVIGTLGLGYKFIGYRHWKFMIEHLEAPGTIDVANLTQSGSGTAQHGEGLVEAFDVGAF
jgi:uncharacterized membrane protein YjgN (DUF898 family)